MSFITYRGKEYIAAKLAAISGQGVSIAVPLDKIDIVASIPSPAVIVVANGDRFDMLGGTLHIDRKTGQTAISQKVKLLSRMVLKKAVPPEVQPVRAAAPAPRYEPRRPPSYPSRYSYDD